MNKYIKSICAGVVATAIVGGLLFLKHSMGFMPDWTLPYTAIAKFGSEGVHAWIVQAVLGAIVWPIIFALIMDFFNGPHWIRGIAFALLAWLVLPMFFAPYVGSEILAGKTAMDLVHLMHMSVIVYAVYGFLLGLFFTVCCKCCNK
jgi:MFS family permease